MNAFFDAAKGVYRVTNPNGSFETYTPAQYREKFGAVASVEEEEESITEVVVTQEVLDENPELVEASLKVGDVGTVLDDTVDFSTPAVEAGTELVVTDETTSPEVELTNDGTNTQI
mgnify:FL=1